jgi:hypothetical protein
MNDLLGSVKGGNPVYDRDDDPEKGILDDNAPPPEPPKQHELSMKEFFKKVEGIKVNMTEIKALQREINDLHERGKTIVKTQAVKAHQEQMQVGGLIGQVNSHRTFFTDMNLPFLVCL